ncbi:MAG: hypothetical protein NTZ65_03465 [Candidatus Berkelbacteria bacterium]|nr:hypothetical protein [Candidatus Berkelbacteria bacterium]
MAEKKKTKKPAIKPKQVKKPVVKKVVKTQAKPALKPVAKFEAPKPAPNLIRWHAPDYYTFEKSPYWSLGVGALAIVLAEVLILTGNYFPVIIVILAVIVTFQVAHEKPKSQEFAIDEGGILSRNEYLPYIELKSFWVAKHGPKSILYIEPVGLLKAPIAIPFGQESQFEIRNFLLRYLPEKHERGEMFSDKLIRIFKL